MKTRLAALSLLAAASLGAAGSADILSQGAWARMLLARLPIAKNLPTTAGDHALEIFAAKSAAITKDGKTAQLVAADAANKTWRFDVTTPGAATWLLVLQNAAPAFVSVDKAPSRLVPAVPGGAGTDAGEHVLLAGSHSVTVALPATAAAPDVSLVSGCSSVAPAGGWQPQSHLTWGAMARTLVEVTRQGSRLPAAEALAPNALTASRVTLQVEREGTYTLLLAGKDLQHASVRLDGCEEFQPSLNASADGWREAQTQVLNPGEHSLSFFGMGTGGDARVRLVRRSATDADHLAVLQSLGVKLPSLTAEAEPRELHAEADLPGRVIGGVHHAKGDALGALANRTVSLGDAEAVLATPAIARLLSITPVPVKRAQAGTHVPEPDEFGTFQIPISPTVPGTPE